MTLREQLEALRQNAIQKDLAAAGTTSFWIGQVAGLDQALEIIERWVDDELPKVIASGVDEALASTQFRDALARALMQPPPSIPVDALTAQDVADAIIAALREQS